MPKPVSATPTLPRNDAIENTAMSVALTINRCAACDGGCSLSEKKGAVVARAGRVKPTFGTPLGITDNGQTRHGTPLHRCSLSYIVTVSLVTMPVHVHTLCCRC